MTSTHSSSRRLLPLLWLSYALFVVYVTTLPFDFDPSLEHARERLAGVSHNPFLSSDGSRASRSDMLQNVVLFVPFGALTVLSMLRRSAPRASDRAPSPQPRAPRATAFLWGGLAGFVLSAGVETLQLFTINRVPSLNDVLSNTVGALSGGIVALVASWAVDRTRGMPRTVDILHRIYPVLLWGGVAALAAWHPFDTTIDVSSVGRKVRALLNDPWQVGALGDEGVDAVRYALFAVSWAVVWKRSNWPRPIVSAALASTVLGLVLETSQFFVSSRSPGLKDIFVATTGGCLGAMCCVVHWPRRRAVIATVLASWLATALMVLSPLLISPEQQPIQYTPFLGYVRPSPERMVSHAVELSMAFFPIGFAIGMVARGRRAWLLTTVVALLLGPTLEYGQSWIVGRYADVTDAGMLILGALAGAWAAFPARSTPEAVQAAK